MYSAASFPHLQRSPPSSRPFGLWRTGTRRADSSSPSPRPHTQARSVSATEPSRPTCSGSAAVPVHSKPVVIPSRSSSHSHVSIHRTRPAQQSQRSWPSRAGRQHDPNAVPPAVAALLAVTAIPKMSSRRSLRSTPVERIMSMDELIQEWKQDGSGNTSPMAASPLDFLLGRVDELEDDYGSLHSLDLERASLSMSRSISSDSVATLPSSLDFEGPSYLSQWTSPATPDSFRPISVTERREKMVSSPPKEDCVLDHPLLHCELIEVDDIRVSDVAEIACLVPAPAERFKTFKSNLTASLQAIRSAAKSFSNFTAPGVPPDDFLTRALLSPIFASEMRPKRVDGVPSPELRRYLNPQPAPISATELTMHLHASLTLDVDADRHAPMIQMQTYERRGRVSKSRPTRNLDSSSESERAVSSEPAVRQREPRENADFLRVIVLEMNMRRVGKLDARAVGRARVWLPPRKTSAGKANFSPNGPSIVPDRWVGVTLG